MGLSQYVYGILCRMAKLCFLWEGDERRKRRGKTDRRKKGAGAAAAATVEAIQSVSELNSHTRTPKISNPSLLQTFSCQPTSRPKSAHSKNQVISPRSTNKTTTAIESSLSHDQTRRTTEHYFVIRKSKSKEDQAQNVEPYV